jgi:hypothetical protein
MAHVPKYVALDDKLYLLEAVSTDSNLWNGMTTNVKVHTQLLFESLKRLDQLVDLGVDGWIILKWIFRSGCGSDSSVSRQRPIIISSGYTKGRKFLDQPSDCQLLNKNSGARN